MSPDFADGKSGPGTKAALLAFQRAYGLTPDGLFGPKTEAALRGSPSGNCRIGSQPVLTATQQTEAIPAQQTAEGRGAATHGLELAALQRKSDELAAENRRLENSISENRLTLRTINESIAALNKKLSIAGSEFSAMEAAVAALRFEESLLRLKVRSGSVTQRAMLHAVSVAESRIEALRLTEAQMVERLDRLKAEIASLETQKPSVSATAIDVSTPADSDTENVGLSNELSAAMLASANGDDRQSGEESVLPNHPVVEESVGVYLPRDLAEVDTALRLVPGWQNWSAEAVTKLQVALADGVCVKDALLQTFGSVNPFVLASLQNRIRACESK